MPMVTPVDILKQFTGSWQHKAYERQEKISSNWFVHRPERFNICTIAFLLIVCPSVEFADRT